MLKARDILAERDVVIVSDEFKDSVALDNLRVRSRSGNIICPVCNQPVVVKAGEVIIRHFAHKHLANCPSQDESVELLLARSVLYKWLYTKFPDSVQIEHRIDGLTLPRPLDCWVQRPKGNFAYWITDRRMKIGDRELLSVGLTKIGAERLVVFTPGLMKRNENTTGVLNLSTTERQFCYYSRYDRAYCQDGGESRSLFYLNGENETLITFRAMQLREPPQHFTGVEISTQMKDVKIHPCTGEFVLPGEDESLRKVMADNARRQQEEAETMRKCQQLEQWMYPERDTEPHASPTYENREGTCTGCGQKTREYVIFWGKDGTCRCKKCGIARNQP